MNTQSDIGGRVEEAWQLFRQQRYAEGFALWHDLLTLPGYERFYLQHGERCLLAGDWKGAIESFLQIHCHTTRPDMRGMVYGIDIALWLGGLGETACWHWARLITRAQSFETTLYGTQEACLLWWASAHPGYRSWRELAVTEIRRVRAATRTGAGGGHGLLADFLLGDLAETTLLSVVKHDDPYSPDDPQVKGARFAAWFYVGARALDNGDTRRYYECMAQAMAHLPDLYNAPPEYFLAFWESRHNPYQLTLNLLA